MLSFADPVAPKAPAGPPIRRREEPYDPYREFDQSFR